MACTPGQLGATTAVGMYMHVCTCARLTSPRKGIERALQHRPCLCKLLTCMQRYTNTHAHTHARIHTHASCNCMDVHHPPTPQHNHAEEHRTHLNRACTVRALLLLLLRPSAPRPPHLPRPHATAQPPRPRQNPAGATHLPGWPSGCCPRRTRWRPSSRPSRTSPCRWRSSTRWGLWGWWQGRRGGRERGGRETTGGEGGCRGHRGGESSPHWTRQRGGRGWGGVGVGRAAWCKEGGGKSARASWGQGGMGRRARSGCSGARGPWGC